MSASFFLEHRVRAPRVLPPRRPAAPQPLSPPCSALGRPRPGPRVARGGGGPRGVARDARGGEAGVFPVRSGGPAGVAARARQPRAGGTRERGLPLSPAQAPRPLAAPAPRPLAAPAPRATPAPPRPRAGARRPWWARREGLAKGRGAWESQTPLHQLAPAGRGGVARRRPRPPCAPHRPRQHLRGHCPAPPRPAPGARPAERRGAAAGAVPLAGGAAGAGGGVGAGARGSGGRTGGGARALHGQLGRRAEDARPPQHPSPGVRPRHRRPAPRPRVAPLPAPRARRGRVSEARGAEGHRGNTTVLLCTDRSAVRDHLAAAGLPVAAPPLLPRTGAGGYTQVVLEAFWSRAPPQRAAAAPRAAGVTRAAGGGRAAGWGGVTRGARLRCWVAGSLRDAAALALQPRRGLLLLHLLLRSCLPLRRLRRHAGAPCPPPPPALPSPPRAPRVTPLARAAVPLGRVEHHAPPGARARARAAGGRGGAQGGAQGEARPRLGGRRLQRRGAVTGARAGEAA